MNYYYGRVMIDSVPVPIMLTEKEAEKASSRAIDKSSDIPESAVDGICWDIDNCKKTKCGLLKRIMGRCCECGEC